MIEFPECFVLRLSPWYPTIITDLSVHTAVKGPVHSKPDKKYAVSNISVRIRVDMALVVLKCLSDRCRCYC